MDDNFSPKVRDVITFSKEEALRLGHDFIGTEHLLLGLIRKGEGKAIEILESFEVITYLPDKLFENPSSMIFLPMISSSVLSLYIKLHFILVLYPHLLQLYFIFILYLDIISLKN